MAATFVILLSCLAYGIVASPSGSYGPSVGGRPSGQGTPIATLPASRPIATGAAVSGPSASNLAPSKGIGRRPSAVAPAVSPPVVSAPASRVPVSVGGKRGSSHRPIDAAPSVQQSAIIGAPSVGVKRPVAQRPAARPVGRPAVGPVVQRPSYAGVAGRPIASPGTVAARPIPSIRQNAGHKGAHSQGSRTVGVKAPY